MDFEALPDEFVRESAAESEYTVSQVEEAVQTIHDAVQDNLYDHYDDALNSGGPDHLLYEIGDEVYFALSPLEVVKEVRDYGAELDKYLVIAGADAYLRFFQDNGHTVSISGTLARHRSHPNFYPIRVFKTEEWKRGEAHALQMFQAYTSRAEMSAAEALDYWASNRMRDGAMGWAGYRDVGPEAVRKNRRQAEEKLDENGLGSGHENNDIRAVPTEKIPENGTHDEDEDRYYIPTDGVLVWEDDEE